MKITLPSEASLLDCNAGPLRAVPAIANQVEQLDQVADQGSAALVGVNQPLGAGD